MDRTYNGVSQISNFCWAFILSILEDQSAKITMTVFALIATSSILLISVPVVFASPDGWSSNKNVIFSGTSLWIGLVFFSWYY